ncbi:MAG: pre-peptidase C-terminal domain-containing protein, partial [Pirellula sp.]|nr:pre-peptidase C-terminal domain-containing protein [Pirellula sp.]
FAGTRLGLFGEEGADTIRFDGGQDGFARGGDGNDVMEISGGSRLVLAGEFGNDTLTIRGGTSGVAAGGVGDDTLEVLGGTSNLLLGQSGNDHLLATGGTLSIVSGGDGDDEIQASNRGDDLYGDDGDDHYKVLATTSTSQLLRLRELQYVDPIDFEPESRGSDTIDLSAFSIGSLLNLGTVGVFNNPSIGLQSVIASQLQLILLGSFENTIGTSGNDSITGNLESNRLEGRGGDDTLVGLGGDDILEGGSGNDVLDGGTGDDVYVFSTSESASLGSDVIYEADGGGVDGLDFRSVQTGLGILDLALATTQTLAGGLLNLTLRQSASSTALAELEEVVGTNANESILGNALDNRFEGLGGDDVMDGRSGSDIYVFTGRDLGADTILDAPTGLGRDTLDFVGFDAPIVIDLAITTPQSLGEMTLTLGAVDSIENVLGSSFDDTIRGNARDNTLFGNAGADLLEGRSGNDRLVADLPVVVLLDFDSAYNAARGDYNYSSAERTIIQNRLSAQYAPFNWSFTQSEAQAKLLSADLSRNYVRLAFSQGRGGGIAGDAGEVDFRNISRRVVSEINVNALIPAIRELLIQQVGPAYTSQQFSEMVVAFTATLAGHELAHTAGLRHGDAFGPIGSGLFQGTDQTNIFPADPRPANGTETGWHMLSSPASTGTPLSDAARATFFGEREAIKMAFNETGRTRRETETTLGSNDAWMLAEPMAPGGILPRLYVPNLAPNSGFVRSGQSFDVSAMAIVGDLHETGVSGLSDRDFYSFTAQAGDYVNVELMVSSIRPLRGEPFDGEIRLYDANGTEIAFNDDDFEGTKDATLIDFLIPTNGIYFVSVGLSVQPAFGTGGRYELLVSRFRVGTAANVVGDTLIGGAGSDVIVGGAADDWILGGGSTTGDLDTIDAKGGYDTVDGQGLVYNYSTTGAPVENVIATVNTPPTVIIQGPQDGLLNVAQTFTFVASDLDAADASGLFEFTIHWGDGTQTIVNSSAGQTSVVVSKTYTSVSARGVFVITAVAKDARNATGPSAQRTFAATGWTIMADPANLGMNMLVLVGTQGSDDIRIRERFGDFLKVRIREREDNIRVRGLVSGDVDRILVFGLDGNDRITIDDDIDTNAEVWGGNGKDDIKGGGGHDILLGGAGDDRIYGGDGRDLIIGGTGADRMYGDAYDDILIAGFTAFDEEFNASAPGSFAASARLAFDVQRQALEAILAEWTSCRSYTTRRNNLLGTGTGTRLNGNYFLKATGATATSNTVFDDGSRDQLWGESGIDWFFANLDGDNQSAKDEVKDRTGSEIITDTDRWW